MNNAEKCESGKNKQVVLFFSAPGAYFTFRFHRFKISCKSRLLFKEELNNNNKKTNEIYLHISAKRPSKNPKHFFRTIKEFRDEQRGVCVRSSVVM